MLSQQGEQIIQVGKKTEPWNEKRVQYQHIARFMGMKEIEFSKWIPNG